MSGAAATVAAATAAEVEALPVRVAALRACFASIAATRMRDVPVMNDRLRVETVGFALCEDADGAHAALGVLLTPWFMNLIRLPLGGQTVAAPGRTREHRIGGERFDFIGADDPGFGPYEMCSLFSPMFEFADQDSARATASEVLRALRRAAAAPLAPKPGQGRESDPGAPSRPGRRGFLTGRKAGAPGTAP